MPSTTCARRISIRWTSIKEQVPFRDLRGTIPGAGNTCKNREIDICLEGRCVHGAPKGGLGCCKSRLKRETSCSGRCFISHVPSRTGGARRSEEHTSELQSRENLVCRLLLEKKKQGRRQ